MLPVLAAQVVQELRKECAGRDGSGRLREGSAVAWSLQRYLIFAILSCIPGPPLPLLTQAEAWQKWTSPKFRIMCVWHSSATGLLVPFPMQ